MLSSPDLTPTTPSGEDAIAVVGVGMRLPGQIRELAALQALLEAGATTLRPLPASRWDAERFGPRAPVGSFLDEVDRFDAEAFGVSPREARELDPQQRLLLEVGTEALGDSGATRAEWAGSATGIYTGVLAADYALLQARTRGPSRIDPYYATGKEPSFGGGRLAHHFDLHGPAVTIATACSSSLVAVHAACAALRLGEIDAAVAGGVNLLLAPELSVFMDRVGALSPTGRCRPFDAAADGVLRGEGCALVVLKRLRDAACDGDHVYAVVRGSALGHDGHSAGLTVPSTAAQVRLGRAALRAAGLEPADIDVVEAHATGTPLGDPIELAALAQLHAGRDGALPVGSHKANLGHLDAAAGIVGLLKAIATVGSGRVPPQPGFDAPTVRFGWDGPLTVMPEGGCLRTGTTERPLRASVSAFGLSGTNAQVIVEAAPAPLPAPRPRRAPLVIALSARTPAGLVDRATRLADRLESTPAAAARLAGAVNGRRDHPEVRAAVHGADAAALARQLRTVAEPVSSSGCDGIVLVLSGQGAQWPGMGLDLLAAEPVFRETLEACDALARPLTGWSIVDELRARPDRLDRTDIAQPVVFAVQVALVRLLASLGVAPIAVVGHSMGEVAAAHVAGALSLEDAAELIVRRGRALAPVRDQGAMLATPLPAAELESLIATLGCEAVLAADNGPRATVASGSDASLRQLDEALRDHGVGATRLPGRYPFHGPLVATAAELRAELGTIVARDPRIRLLSTVTGGEMPPVDAAYWESNAARPVRLWPALEALLADADPLLVEVGPHPVLRAGLASAARRPVLATLRRGGDGPAQLAALVAGLHAGGAAIDWHAWHGGRAVNMPLPPPDWRDERAWLEGVEPGQQTATAPADGTSPGTLRVLDGDGREVGRLRLDGPAPHGARAQTATGEAALTAEPPAAEPATVAARADATAAAGPATAGDPLEIVCAAIRDVLELPHDRPIAPRRSIFELGLDSVSAAELAGRLSAATRRELAPTLVFEHPTPATLAAALADPAAEIPDAAALAAAGATGEPSAADAAVGEPAKAEPAGAKPAPAAPRRPSASGVQAIAVVGMACRVPGASSVDELWSLLTARECAVRELPADRLARDGWDPLHAPTHAGLLEDVTGVDCAFLGVSPREADAIDPQQRLFVEVAWEALADAGADGRDREVGVYVGLNSADYGQRVAGAAGDVPPHFGTGTSFAATAGRLSYLLGLRGPSLAVDSACSASLTAVHLACQALRAGECATAVAGGANILAGPAVSVAMARAGALAPDGRCKTFAEAADGYGRGEGAGAIVLRPLQAAIDAGDRIHAVLLGSAVNQDGASGGFTIPSADAQIDVVRSALGRAGRTPDDVDYVEAHGTGTPLGDPIELRALGEVFAGRSDSGPAVGSVKANLGHLEAAAGITGLIKVIAALGAGELPAHLLHGAVTSRVDWPSLRLRIAGAGEAWTGANRVAGVSAFGFTGSNAHVVVGPAPARAARTSDLPPTFVLPLSAAGDDALRAHAGALADHLETHDIALADVVFTLCRRRIDLAERAVVVAGERAEAVAGLRALAAGTPRASLVRAGDVPAADSPLHDAARTWVAGEDARWGAACPAHGEVVALPAYPWQRRPRWWRDAAPAAARSARAAADGAPRAAAPSRPAREVGIETAEPTLAAAGGAPRAAAPSRPACDGGIETAEPALAAADGGPRAARTTRAMADGAPEATVPPHPAGAGGLAVRDAVVAWVRRPAPAPVDGARIGLAGELDGQAGWVAETLRADGVDVRAWPLPDLPDPAGWGSLLDGAARERVPFVALVAADAGGRAAAHLVAAGRAAIAQTGARVALALLTDRAFTGDHDQTAAWEVGRVLAVEIGDAWRAAIDAPGAQGAVAAAALSADALDDQLRLAHAGWRTARLRPLDAAQPATAVLDGDAWHAVSAANTPAGRSAVAWLRARGARRLLLGLRDAADPDGGAHPAAAAAGERSDRDARAHPAAAASDERRGRGGDADETVQTVPEGELPARARRLVVDGALATIVHCPTPVLSAPLAETAPDDPRAEAETELLRDLDTQTRGARAPMLVVLGQGASTWGALGATGAALASGPCAAVVRDRAAHAPARLLGALVRSGVREVDERQAGLLADSGVAELSEPQLHEALDRLLAGDEVERTGGLIDLRRYVALSQQLAPRALLGELEEDEPATDAGTTDLRRELEALDRDERETRLTEHVGACAADALGLDEADVAPRSGLFDLGLDSIMALGLKARLERDLAPLQLPADITVDLPTPAALGSHLATLLEPAGAANGSAPAPSRRPPEPAPQPRPPGDDARPTTHDDAQPPTDDHAQPPTEDGALAALEAALASANDLLAQGGRT